MDGTRAFDTLEKEFFNTWVRRNPLLATRLGIRRYDTAMPDGTLDREMEDHRLLKRFLSRFEAIDAARLPPPRRIDRDLLVQVLRLRLFELEELAFWRSIPEAPAKIGEALFQLLVCEALPLVDRLRCITERLERAPRYLNETRAKLTRPVKVWIDTELETIARLPSYFDAVKQAGRINLIVREYDRLCRAIDGIQNAMEDYTNWIIIDILPRCVKEFAMGHERFARLLKLRGIDESPEELVSFGWRQARWQEATLRRFAHRVQRGAGVEEVRQKIRGDHPNNFAEVLNAVRETVKRTRDIVARAGFATIPDGEELRVTETPVFLRHRCPFGAYLPPPRFEAKAVGLYFVTPGEVDRDLLKEHNRAALANMSVHEGYPGHHLQFACAHRHKSLARVFACAPETVEGWAHYCEEEMKRIGFDTSLESRFMLTQDMVWRASRVALDVRLSTGKVGVEDAIQQLMRGVGMDRMAATAEVRRYTQTPGVPLSYLYGRERIKALKQACRRRLGRHYSDRFFHDAILYAGALPLKLMAQELEWKMVEELKKPKAPEVPEVKAEGAKGKAKPSAKGAAAGAAGAAARRPVKAAEKETGKQKVARASKKAAAAKAPAKRRPAGKKKPRPLRRRAAGRKASRAKARAATRKRAPAKKRALVRRRVPARKRASRGRTARVRARRPVKRRSPARGSARKPTRRRGTPKRKTPRRQARPTSRAKRPRPRSSRPGRGRKIARGGTRSTSRR